MRYHYLSFKSPGERQTIGSAYPVQKYMLCHVKQGREASGRKAKLTLTGFRARLKGVDVTDDTPSHDVPVLRVIFVWFVTWAEQEGCYLRYCFFLKLTISARVKLNY